MSKNQTAGCPFIHPDGYAMIVVTILCIAWSLKSAEAAAAKRFNELSPSYYASPYPYSYNYQPYSYGGYSPYYYGYPYNSQPYSYGYYPYNSQPYSYGYPYSSQPYYYGSPYYYSPSPYYYTSQSSPPNQAPPSSSPTSPTSKDIAYTSPAYQSYYPPKTAVTGLVYCDACKDGKYKKPLTGIKVVASCLDGSNQTSFDGITDSTGRFRIELDGYDYQKWGGKNCNVRLAEAPPSCNIGTGLPSGETSAQLHIKSTSKDEVVLESTPFAYVSENKFDECEN
eukprot:c29130_g1_i1 orf=326-1168(+)